MKDVLRVVDNPDVVKPRHLRADHGADGDHQVWCEQTWKHVVATLEHWTLELRQLKVANDIYLLLYTENFIDTGTSLIF